MTNPDDSCPGCENHPQNISDRMLKLFQQFKESKDPHEKAALANELAEVSLYEHDFTDAALSDEYHRYFEEFQAARDAYDRSSLKLARLQVNFIENYLEIHGTTVESSIGGATPNKSSN